MVTPVTESALEVQNLVKSYRAKKAVRGISFAAEFGEITAVLGPNGAGKTTTIECCEGLRDPDGGEIRILGQNPRVASSQVRSQIGVMLQDGGLPMAVPASSVLRHVGQLYGDRSGKRASELVERLELGTHLKTPVRRLSGGNRQRLGLACALLGDPKVLFLDEPTAGMDPHARVAVHNLITETKERGTAIILTTHLLDEAEMLADQVILMAGGKIRSAGTVAEITTGGGEGIEVVLGAATTREALAGGLDARYQLAPAAENGTGEAGRAWQITPAPDPGAFAVFAAQLASLELDILEVRQLTDLTSLFLKLADTPSGEDSK